MKTYTKTEIQKILNTHQMWLSGKSSGVKADLSRANLSWVDLSWVDLSWVNLYGADLSGADLSKANLSWVNLSGANLSRANLSWANLYGANMSGANLSRANLSGARLSKVNLSKANLSEAILPHFQLCPQEGSFVAYKKTTKGVIKLLIPEGAKRTNSLVGRKCRANKVEVLGGEGVGGVGPNYKGIVYNLGVIECPDYDDDIRVECTKGIHFFMTKEEAEEYK